MADGEASSTQPYVPDQPDQGVPMQIPGPPHSAAEPHAQTPPSGGTEPQAAEVPHGGMLPHAGESVVVASPSSATQPSGRKAVPLWVGSLEDGALAALAILLYLLLADAVVETILNQSPVQWIVLGTMAAYFIVSAALWRYMSWSARVAASILVVLALAAGTAWLPGGLTHGIALLRQPTETILAAVTGLALLLAILILVRWKFVPLWGRVALGVIALYGVVAAALGVRAHAAYADLFHGHSEWRGAPVWLQGVVVGTGLLAGTLVVHLGYGLARIRGRGLRMWGLEAAVLALAVVVATAGFRGSPVAFRGFVLGPTPTPSPIVPAPGPAPAPSPITPQPGPAPTPSPAGPGPAPTPSPITPQPGPAPTPAPSPAGPGPAPAPSPITPQPGPAPTPAPSPAGPSPTPGPSPVLPAPAPRASAYAGTLYFTRFNPNNCPNVNKVAFTYTTDSEFALEKPEQVACLPNADGVIFAPDGDLVVGGGDYIFKVNARTGKFTSVKSGAWALHLMLDPNQQQLWASSIPGTPTAIPLNPFADGTPHALTGDDASVTTIVWDAAGHAFYTASGSPGNGNFGTIDLAQFKTTRLLSNLPAAHGMAFDPFTQNLILMGSTHLTQIDPRSPATIVSELVIDHVDQGNLRYAVQFDQGTIDGQGHIYAASNNGHLVFVDYSLTKRIGDPKNFKAVQFLSEQLDDIAPIVGPGAAKVRPQPKNYQVIEEQGRIRIILGPEVLFDFDMFNLKASANAALSEVKRAIIDKYPGAHLIVEGHTDDRGSQAYNLKLGADRAQSVATWLTGHGISAALVETRSYGKTRPRFVPETTEPNRTRNRRVEIIVVK